MFRILIIEDEEDIRNSLKVLLENWDQSIEARAPETVAEALTLALAEPFDLALLDVMMPPSADMDAEALRYGRETGIEVTRRLRQTTSMPIIAVTVVTDPIIRNRLRENGVTAIVTKPFELEALFEKIKPFILTKNATERLKSKV